MSSHMIAAVLLALLWVKGLRLTPRRHPPDKPDHPHHNPRMFPGDLQPVRLTLRCLMLCKKLPYRWNKLGRNFNHRLT
ncbi:hypothetical protein Thimo_1913 [Thioflavicoccus mobilis 8321]|uniref:Uncharacterized protein n=1 Tax=Thioflavicoccus mobilis 8321 TaxID=765912 RepID=L0GV97_9GAMM|nr:hypothetical protein Thimo_1913 [Thioflavicoccus mobilis 8321]